MQSRSSSTLLIFAFQLIFTVSSSAAVIPTVAEIFDPSSIYPMPYQLYAPPNLDASHKYPLILALHGSGERGNDNVSQMNNFLSLLGATQSDPYASFLLAPQLPRSPSVYGWDPYAPFDRTMDILNHVLAEYPEVDTSRIYITGLSMGGFGTFDYIAAFPDLFAAAIPIAGGGDVNSASAIKHIPIWIISSTEDNVVPPELSREMVVAITAAGGAPKYTEFPIIGHYSWAFAYSDVDIYGNPLGFYDWLYAQKQTVPEPSTFALTAIAALVTTLLSRVRSCGIRRARSTAS